MPTNTQRYGEITSARDPASFLQCYYKYASYLVHDGSAFKAAAANLELTPFTDDIASSSPLRKILAIFSDLSGGTDDVNSVKFDIFKDLAARIYRNHLFSIGQYDSENPIHLTLAPAFLACQPADQIKENITTSEIQILIAAILRYTFSSYNADQLIAEFSAKDNFKKYIFVLLDSDILHKVSDGISDSTINRYAGLEPRIFGSEVLQMKRFILKLMADDDAKKEFIEQIYSGHIVSENFQDLIDGLYNQYGKVFETDPNRIPNLLDTLYEMYYIFNDARSGSQKTLKTELENEIVTLISLEKDGISDAVLYKSILSLIRDIANAVSDENSPETMALLNDAIAFIRYMQTHRGDITPKIYVPPKSADDETVVTEAYDRKSARLQSATSKIYEAYKNYKNNEQKVDSQVSKMVEAARKLATNDARTTIIEGKKFSAIGLLKTALSTAAVFAFGPVKGLILLVVRYALKKKTSNAERRKIVLELQTELDMINEKIEDARGDNNRPAKYALMRERAEIQAAIGKIKYSIDVDRKTLEGAKTALDRRIGTRKKGGKISL